MIGAYIPKNRTSEPWIVRSTLQSMVLSSALLLSKCRSSQLLLKKKKYGDEKCEIVDATLEKIGRVNERQINDTSKRLQITDILPRNVNCLCK